jgi:hypothetical protein
MKPPCDKQVRVVGVKVWEFSAVFSHAARLSLCETSGKRDSAPGVRNVSVNNKLVSQGKLKHTLPSRQYHPPAVAGAV